MPEHQTPLTTCPQLGMELDGPVLTVTVDRPAALNALSSTVLGGLRGFLSAEVPAGVRGVLLTGAGGRAFVAGADIREMAAMSADEGEAFGRLGQEVTELLERYPVPVVACVDGYAFGGGCELAMACDFVYCTRTSVFGQPEVTLGLIPGFGGCVRLPRLVGPAMARELIYTGRRVPADEAARIGLVNRVFDDRDAMLAAAAAAVHEVAARSPAAVSICKAVLDDTAGLPTAAALDRERVGFRQAFLSTDRAEGTRAFLDKRAPVFDRGESPVGRNHVG